MEWNLSWYAKLVNVALIALGAIKLGYKVIIPNNLVGTVMVKQEQKYRKKLIKKGATFC
ncbi:MAG: hypothetical protein ACI33J_09690 [Clostridium sp.]